MQECLNEIIHLIVDICTCNGRLPLSNIEFAFNYRHGPSSESQTKNVVQHFKNKRPGETTTKFSFYSADELYQYIIAQKYIGIHRGPYFHFKHNDSKERSNLFIHNPQPLIFDIDGTDYAHIRSCKCGKEKKVCNDCWEECIIPAIDAVFTLCIQLGFRHGDIIFSGRRGVHIYVTDAKVWYLCYDQRKMIVDRILNAGVIIDSDVTLKLAHLTKAPMFYHPDTGNICMPITKEWRPEGGAVHYLKATKEQIQGWIKQLRTSLVW